MKPLIAVIAILALGLGIAYTVARVTDPSCPARGGVMVRDAYNGLVCVKAVGKPGKGEHADRY